MSLQTQKSNSLNQKSMIKKKCSKETPKKGWFWGASVSGHFESAWLGDLFSDFKGWQELMSYIRNSKEVELQHSRDWPSQLLPRGCIVPQPVSPKLSWSCKSGPRDEEASLSWEHCLDGPGKKWGWNYTEENTAQILKILNKADSHRFALIIHPKDGDPFAGVF